MSSANWNCRCLGPEAIRGQLEKGLSIYRQHLDARPTVFGRRRFGMTPVLPQILDHLGFTGAVHATLDDGRFPVGNTSRQRWEGIDGTTVEALFRVPVDASRAEGFLRLPHALSGVADMDNQPTVIFAHWPGNTSPWYEDIHRARRYTTVLGSFLTLPDYFERTGMSGHQTAPKADEYRSPYLQQAVAAGQADPISRWVRYYQRRTAAEAAQVDRHPGHFGRRQAFGLRRRPLGRYRRLVGDARRRCLAGRATGRRSARRRRPTSLKRSGPKPRPVDVVAFQADNASVRSATRRAYSPDRTGKPRSFRRQPSASSASW